MEITIGGRTLSQIDSPSLARLSGTFTTPTSYYSYNNHMTITFSSDSANHGNFEIRLNPGKGQFTSNESDFTLIFVAGVVAVYIHTDRKQCNRLEATSLLLTF